MLDRIDSCEGRAENSARAMSMGGDLEAAGMRHVDDALHLCVGEMLFEAACARIEHPASGHDLDHVDAGGGEAAHDLLAFLDAGADRRVEVRLADCFGELGREAGRLVAMAADNRQRRARDLDPGAGETTFGDGVANCDDRAGVAAKIAHRGEPGARHIERVGQADSGRIWF